MLLELIIRIISHMHAHTPRHLDSLGSCRSQKETFFEIMEDNIKSSKIIIRDCSGPGVQRHSKIIEYLCTHKVFSNHGPKIIAYCS